MKARLIENLNGKYQILCADGSIINCTDESRYSFLVEFMKYTMFHGEDGTWRNDCITEMSLYPGKTIAVISDDYKLLIYNSRPFADFVKKPLPPTSIRYLNTAEYGAIHHTGSEIIKRYCRNGKIPGAQRVGSTWMIPADAPYPVPLESRLARRRVGSENDNIDDLDG